MRPLELAGQRFGRLVAIRRATIKTSDGKWLWECACDCGNSALTSGKRLKEGMTKSCGCLRAEALDQTTHGMYRSGTHNSWRAMFDRCENQKNAAYPDYGGRGISICDRWRRFSNFLADMGPKPSSKHSIDRVNNDGCYEPDNCRWATHREQASNRRAKKAGYTRLVTFRKIILCAQCGKSHTAKSPSAMYCSASCCQTAFAARRDRR